MSKKDRVEPPNGISRLGDGSNRRRWFGGRRGVAKGPTLCGWFVGSTAGKEWLVDAGTRWNKSPRLGKCVNWNYVYYLTIRVGFSRRVFDVVRCLLSHTLLYLITVPGTWNPKTDNFRRKQSKHTKSQTYSPLSGPFSSWPNINFRYRSLWDLKWSHCTDPRIVTVWCDDFPNKNLFFLQFPMTD